jgi:hypothetical protein
VCASGAGKCDQSRERHDQVGPVAAEPARPGCGVGVAEAMRGQTSARPVGNSWPGVA